MSQPNSIIYLLKGCPLDKEYRHTKYFTSVTQQKEYFESLKISAYGTFSEQTYQRVNKGTIRLAVLADNIYNANYMMFQNTVYGSKWFYAFIDSVDYINDNVTEINYTIDVMQTWMFDYSMGGCFVEREHALTDVAGDNLVPENLEIGEKRVVQKEAMVENAQYMLGAIVLKKIPAKIEKVSYSIKLPTFALYSSTANVDLVGVDCIVSPAEPISQGSAVYIITGLPLTYDDAVYFANSEHAYRDYQVNGTVSLPGITEQTGYATFYSTLTDIANGRMYGYTQGANEESPLKMGTDDIVGVYTYPAYFALNTALNAATTSNLPNYSALQYYKLKYKTQFDVGVAAYTPKNKKLLTSPYNDVTITNGMGDESILKYENFSDKTNMQCNIFSVLYSSPAVCVCPSYYLGVGNNYREAILQSNYPVPVYTGNAYADWLKDNRASWINGVVSSAVTGVAGTVVAGANGNIAAMVTNSLSLASNIGASMAKMYDIRQKSPSCVYQAISQLLSMSINELQFYAQYEQIKPEFVYMIDEYFSMFGYATKRVKIPNVKNPSLVTKLRPSWNYIKTKGCMIHATDDGKSVPADVEAEIERIYDNGITFWMPEKEVGDYTQDNSPIT